MSRDRIELGKQGERAAAQYLQAHAYTVLHRNWRCRFGELDIVAEHLSTLVFVEVRTRSTISLGTAEESVNLRKQRQVRRIAQHFLHTEKRYDCSIRFDVIALRMQSDGSIEDLNHIIHAF